MKQDFHKELELKDGHIKKLSEEVQALNLAVQNEKMSKENIEKACEVKIMEIQTELETLKENVEEERHLHKSVHDEKKRAIKCIQQAHEEKIKEWKVKLDTSQQTYQEEVKQKEQIQNKLKNKEDECSSLCQTVKEKNSAIKELEQEMNKLQQNINTLNLEYEKKDLDSSSKEAEIEKQVRKYENEVSNLKLEHKSQIEEYQSKIIDLNAEIENLKQRFSDETSKINFEINSLKRELQEKEATIKQLETSLQTEEEKLLMLSPSEYGELQEQIKKITNENYELIEQIKNLKEERDKYFELQNQYQSQLKSQELEMSKLSKENVQEISKKEDEYQTKLHFLQSQSASIQAMLTKRESELNQQIKQLEKDLEDKSKMINREEMSSLELKHNQDLEKINQLNAERDKLKQENQNLLKQNQELNSSLKNFEKERLLTENKYVELKKSLVELEHENNENMQKHEQELDKSVSEFKLALEDAEQKLQNSLKEKQETFNELSISKENIKSLEQQVLSLKNNFTSCENELKKEISNLNSHLNNETNKMANTEREYELKIKNLSDNITQLRSEKEALAENRHHCNLLLEENIQKSSENEKVASEVILNLKQEKEKLEEMKSNDSRSFAELNNQLKEKLNYLEHENLIMHTLLEYSGLISDKSDLSEIMGIQDNTQDFSNYLKSYSNGKICLENKALKEEVKNLEILIKNKISSSELNNDDVSDIFHNKDILNNCETKHSLQQNMSEFCDIPADINTNSINVEKLKAEIFIKNQTLSGIHDDYKKVLNEKDSVIKDLEARCKLIEENPEAVCSEMSDWDDTWVVPEEPCESTSPVSNDETPCDKHLKQMETMQEELRKSNSELNDLRFLLEMYSGSNNFSSNNSIPEPTEIEYLKNILFAYMMGKETETLAKVIAAVLKFDDEQTKMVVDKEKHKHFSKN